MQEKTLFQHTANSQDSDGQNAFQDSTTLLKWKFIETTLKNIEGSFALTAKEARNRLLNDKPWIRFYTDKAGAMAICYNEIATCLDEDNIRSAVILSVMCSSINRLKRCYGREIDDNLISNLLLRDQNKEDIMKTGEELEKEGNQQLAAAYYFKAYESVLAINCLISGHLYRDAFLAARLHFALDDPLVRKSAMLWIEELIQADNVESAVLCWLSINEYSAAIDHLLKRNDFTCRKLALKIAGRSELIDKRPEIFEIARNLILEYLEQFNYWDFSDVVHDCPILWPWRYVADMHQYLAFIFSQLNVSFNNVEPSLKVKPQNFSGQNLSKLSEANFSDKVRNLLFRSDLNTEGRSASAVIEYFELEIEKDHKRDRKEDNLQSMLIYVAINATLAYLHLPDDKKKARCRFESCFQFLEKFKTADQVLRFIVGKLKLNTEENGTDRNVAVKTTHHDNVDEKEHTPDSNQSSDPEIETSGANGCAKTEPKVLLD